MSAETHPRETYPQLTPIRPTVYFDGRRYLRVAQMVGDRAECVVAARCVGDRIVADDKPVRIAARVMATMTKVDSVPPPSGPDYGRVLVDRRVQAVDVDGKLLPYAVTSAGPRIKRRDDGSWLVTITLTTRQVGDANLANQLAGKVQFVDGQPDPVMSDKAPALIDEMPQHSQSLIDEALRQRQAFIDGEITPYDFAQAAANMLPALFTVRAGGAQRPEAC